MLVKCARKIQILITATVTQLHDLVFVSQYGYDNLLHNQRFSDRSHGANDCDLDIHVGTKIIWKDSKDLLLYRSDINCYNTVISYPLIVFLLRSRFFLYLMNLATCVHLVAWSKNLARNDRYWWSS